MGGLLINHTYGKLMSCCILEDSFLFLLTSNGFCSNYVDHHVSTREQITLQDTMEGMAYSTSQFGLDGKDLCMSSTGLD